MGLNIPVRRPDWRKTLIDYLVEVDSAPFRPGKHDCALFCSGAVRAMTGHDCARGWRGYRTLKAGQKKLAENGIKDWWDMLDDRACEASQMRLGDIAVVEHEGALAGGVCLGANIAVVTPSGRGLVQLSCAVKGFHI